MQTLGMEFEIVPAEGPECPPAGASPERTVEALSLAKAREAAAKRPDALVIGA